LSGSFSRYAEEKLRDLYANHANEVGSRLKSSDPVAYAAFTSTDCITYVMNVISYAFESTDNAAAARKAGNLSRYGTDLAKYLVVQHAWSGIYINPDRVHPKDLDSEHTFSAARAMKSCTYYGIPLRYHVTNYNVTKATDPEYRLLNKTSGPTTLNSVDMASLDLVSFGFGLSRGGRHTWLFSRGKVYEVHWDRIGADLYEASPLRTFG